MDDDILQIERKKLDDVLESYKEAHRDYKELLDVYNKLEKLKTKWLFDAKLGEESELTDEIVIWMWEVMELRKLEMEIDGG